jgi:muramoyltetrapeptide carboxypeptidase LdcA involved in peptidoglycan recycling
VADIKNTQKKKHESTKMKKEKVANFEISMLQQIIDDFYDIVQNSCISRRWTPLIQNRSENKSVGGTFLQTKILNNSLCGGNVAMFQLICQVQYLPCKKGKKVIKNLIKLGSYEIEMVKEKSYLLGCNRRHCCLGSKVYIEKTQTKKLH